MRSKIFFLTLFLLSAFAVPSQAANGIAKNNAKMQAMDKITGRVSVIDVPVGGMVKFGSLSIVIRSCKTRPVEEAPDNFAFADISDKNLQGDEFNIFKGWMISSSPATHAVEHPIYDVWLLQCTDEKVDKNLLLSEEQLSQHDSLPKADNILKGSDSGNRKEAETKSEIVTTISEIESDSRAKTNNQPISQETEFFYDEEEGVEDTPAVSDDENLAD